MHAESHRKHKWIFDHRRDDLRGWRVRDPRGETLGRVTDLLVDPESSHVKEVTLDDGRTLSAHDLRIGDNELQYDGGTRDERAPLRAVTSEQAAPPPTQRVTAEPSAAQRATAEARRAAEPAGMPRTTAAPRTVEPAGMPRATTAPRAVEAAPIPPATTAPRAVEPAPIPRATAAPRTTEPVPIPRATAAPRTTEPVPIPRATTPPRAVEPAPIPSATTAPRTPEPAPIPRTSPEPAPMPRASVEPRIGAPSARTATTEPMPATETRGASARTSDGDIVMQIVDEDLEIGKRRYEAGGTRVSTHVVSRPVSQQVHLAEEHVIVERKKVDRDLGRAEAEPLLRDETFEVKQTAQVPCVCKTAHVVEEIVLKRSGFDHDEIVRDTVRHTDVDVTNLGAETEKGLRR